MPVLRSVSVSETKWCRGPDAACGNAIKFAPAIGVLAARCAPSRLVATPATASRSAEQPWKELGRASCRDRLYPSVKIPAAAVSLTKTTQLSHIQYTYNSPQAYPTLTPCNLL